MSRSRRSWLVAAGGAAVLLLLVSAWLVWQVANWPDVDGLSTHNPVSTAFIERYKGGRRAAGHDAAVRQNWVPYTEIADPLKRAVLVAEDINFFSHRGFDTGEMRQAVREALSERKRPRGASTITQQLARNLWLSPAQTPLRKMKEALLTRELERKLSKKRILELYLNVVEFGPGVYGAEAASRHYFYRSARELDETQAARLAAGLPSPARWNPERIPADHWRVRLILERMNKAQFLRRRI